jgi:hypothetical protein
MTHLRLRIITEYEAQYNDGALTLGDKRAVLEHYVKEWKSWMQIPTVYHNDPYVPGE